MNTSTPRVAAVGLVVLLTGRPVQALIPDPVEAGLLTKIADAIRAIEQFRMRVMAQLQAQISTRINAYAFPNRLFDPIRATATSVLDIRSDLQRMACAWPMSARTRSLSDLFWERTRFCRGEFQWVWGSHERFWDGPIQEANDYVAAMTANMISERAEKTSTSWVSAHQDLFETYALLRSSPGEANRAEAAGLAWANEVVVANGQIVTQHLLVRQLDRTLERFDQKKSADVTYYLYRGLGTLAGGDWMGVPPDPGEGRLR